MAKFFRPNIREEKILSKLDHTKDYQRIRQINLVRSQIDELSSQIAHKLVDKNLVQTNKMDEFERQIFGALKKLVESEDFDIQYQIAPYRTLVPQPNMVSLFVTAYLLEKIINHPCIIDIFGTDEEIYRVIHNTVANLLK